MRTAEYILILCILNIHCLVWNIQFVMGEGMSNFKMEAFYLCEEVVDHKITFFACPKNFNRGTQLIDMNMSIPMPIANDALAKILLEFDAGLTTKHSWVHLFETEDNYCRMIDRYMGEFWYDIQRAFAIMPYSCPPPRGTYHASNYQMNYEKIKLQTFPFGKIRVTISVSVKTNKNIQGCARMIMSNV